MGLKNLPLLSNPGVNAWASEKTSMNVFDKSRELNQLSSGFFQQPAGFAVAFGTFFGCRSRIL